MHFSCWEKLGFGILVAAWVAFGSNFAGNMLIHAEQLDEPAYKVEIADAEGGTATEKEAAPDENALELLASVDIKKGEKVFKKCKACHSDDEGGANKVGPNLWNIVGRAKAAADGFAYSEGLVAMGGAWSFEDLDHFLANPKGFVAGTKMSFNGLKKASDRAAVLLYLHSQSSAPIPLP